MLLIVIFLYLFAAMLISFYAVAELLRSLGSTCSATRLCEVYSAAWRGAAAILIFTAIALLLAFIISLIVLYIESVLRGLRR